MKTGRLFLDVAKLLRRESGIDAKAELLGGNAELTAALTVIAEDPGGELRFFVTRRASEEVTGDPVRVSRAILKGIEAARKAVPPSVALGNICEWGRCEHWATSTRLSPELKERWLKVCHDHSEHKEGPPEEVSRERIEALEQKLRESNLGVLPMTREGATTFVSGLTFYGSPKPKFPSGIMIKIADEEGEYELRYLSVEYLAKEGLCFPED